MKLGFESLSLSHEEAGTPLPKNSRDRLLRPLDCAVIERVHAIWEEANLPPFDSVRGVFVEDSPVYSGAAFDAKTHIQVAVRNAECIKGVFRVPSQHLQALPA